MLEELRNKKLLVIVESPNKVHLINEYLKKAGYHAKVMASVGHIMTLQDGGSYYNSGVCPEKDFALQLAVATDKKEVVNKLKTQAADAELVVLMSDSDREGELISWSLVKFLKLKPGSFVRATTHEITPKAVVAALENATDIDNNLVEAGLARLTLDKMVGYRLSPVARTYIGAKSVGRCQSAGLKLLADRENEIQNFVPEKYYELYFNFTKNNTYFKAKYLDKSKNAMLKLPTLADVQAIAAECTGNYCVDSVLHKNHEESPKPPFCTSTYQQEINSKLGISVKDAMSIAQKLFENGYITYHRTDDQSMSPEFIITLRKYITAAFSAGAYTPPRAGKKQELGQEGHECLRVTDPYLTPDEFNKIVTQQLQQKVYKIIWQRTIAAALPNAVISETIYEIKNGKHYFSTTANELVSAGYRVIYNKDLSGDVSNISAEVTTMGVTFTEGEILAPVKSKTSLAKSGQNKDDLYVANGLSYQLKETKPSARFTEATFIKALEKSGIGRPSTYASIVDTLLSTTRGYCELDGKYLVPSNRGLQLSAFLDRAFSNIINIDYTKEMEKQLDLIAAGKVNKLAFLSSFYTTIENSITGNQEIAQMPSTDKVCPKCGGNMAIRRNKFGKLFYGCCSYPKCNGIINVHSN